MKKYENFSPEIEDTEDKESSGISNRTTTEEPSSKDGSSRRISTDAPQRNRRKNSTKTSPKNTRGKRVQATVNKARTPSVKETVIGWANTKSLRLIIGIFLGLFGAYLSVAFISYLSSCIADQSAVLSDPIGYSRHIENAAGEAGARLSQLFINDTFGMGAAVIVFWLFAMCLKLLAGKPHFKSVNFTIKCIVALITTSLIVGLLTLGINTPVNWGGMHGRYINEFIINFFGWSGAVMLCIFMIALFVVICLRDITNWLLRLKKARDKRKAALEEERRIQEAKRRALMEDEMRERQEHVAAGEAPEPDEKDLPNGDTVLAFGSNNSLNPEEDQFESYVLTDEEEIRNRKGGSTTPSSPASETIDGDNTDAFSSYSLEDTNSGEDESHVDYDDTDKSGPSGITASVVESDPDKTDGKNATDDVEVMEIRTNTIKQTDEVQNVAKPIPTSHPYTFPPTDILRPGPQRINVDRTEQYENQERIRQTLLDFKIPIQSIDATVGPTVTLYEIVPAIGIKVNTISNLVDDIALRLAAIGVRIIAPIPGRGTIGIEVANKEPQIVSMRSILNSEKFKNTKYHLPIALGATIENDVYIADLAKMPHLLVAGATGQGKSVGLNAIIASLLYSKTPDEVKFVMIDPKMVEFSLYAKIEQHYLAKLPDESEPIITEMDKVVATLSSLCEEMDDRYKLLKGHARNVEEYNDKFKRGVLNTLDGHRFLPYIVVIVDEFSDLIMTAGREVEMPIARLAQKARAVGMHVIIATQRPSTKVITGNIKANFPARISFKVTSGVDSKTILDQTGAQQLIGRGDMLISNNSETVRVQCAFIDTPEVEDIVDYIESQPHAPGPYILPEPKLTSQDTDSERGHGNMSERDPLLVEAGRSVVMANQASASSLQRRYSIGYNRAGKIMDQLEAMGVVGPSQGGKPRSVLVDAITYEQMVEGL